MTLIRFTVVQEYQRGSMQHRGEECAHVFHKCTINHDNTPMMKLMNTLEYLMLSYRENGFHNRYEHFIISPSNEFRQPTSEPLITRDRTMKCKRAAISICVQMNLHGSLSLNAA